MFGERGSNAVVTLLYKRKNLYVHFVTEREESLETHFLHDVIHEQPQGRIQEIFEGVEIPLYRREDLGGF